MKTWFLLLCWSFLVLPKAHSQIVPNSDPNAPLETWSWSINPISTGQASGHIADLTITNTSSADATFPEGPMMIPSDGQYQPYIVPYIPPTPIPSGQVVTIPLEGYCTDVYKPTAPVGYILPLPADLSSSDFEWLTHLDRIITAASEILHVSGYTPTPLRDNPEKEKEVVIQQVFWVHTSSLNGRPYGFAEFCTTALDQFSEYDDGPTSPSGFLDRILQSDVSRLWRVITDVGKAAEIPQFCTVPSFSLSDYTKVPYPVPISLHPDIVNMITATGTGRTTGHIADLKVINPTNDPIIVTFGPNTELVDGGLMEAGTLLPPGAPMFIPSDGGYQPYIVPSLGPIIVDPLQTVITPVVGFCVDIYLPPVPPGAIMPPIRDWITTPLVDSPKLNFKPRFMPPNIYVKGGQQVVQPKGIGGGITIITPTKLSFSLDQSVELLSNTLPPVSRPIIQWGVDNNSTPVIVEPGCIPQHYNYIPTIPGSTIPFPVTVNLEKNPSVGVPLLIDALDRIAATYDDLKDKGSISTPFGGNPEKEREAVIQQTFWLYAAALTDKEYNKDAFKGRTLHQFEQNTGKPISSMPQSQQDNITKGVDDFWNTFEAVGVEAKILSVPVIVPDTPAPVIDNFWDKYNTAEAKVID